MAGGSTAGKAGGGDDLLTGGAGNDLLFGDGFTAIDMHGGYGGGGGGETVWYGSGGKGGIGAGKGYSGGREGDSSWLGPLNLGTGHQARRLGLTEDNWRGGAGVRSSNLHSGSDTDAVTADLSYGAAANVAAYGGRSVYDKVVWDLSLGTKGMGSGNSSSDAVGTGNGGLNIDLRLYNQATGSGADVLQGGPGNDWLMGGGGADSFVWIGDDMDGGSDYIVDFNARQGDLLRFDASKFQGYRAGADLRQWFKSETGLTQASPFDAGKGIYSRLTVDLSGQANFFKPDQVIYLRGDASAQPTLAASIDITTQALTQSQRPVMNARLSEARWAFDRGVLGSLDETDVIELEFSAPVTLSQSSLPVSIWGNGAAAKSLYVDKGASSTWSITLGKNHTVTAGGILTLISVKDAAGVDGNAQIVWPSAASTASIKPYGSDALYEGIEFYGKVNANTNLLLKWGTVSANFSSDASGTWRYSYYENNSLFGQKAPVATTDQTVSLFQVNGDGTTSKLWEQNARIDLRSPELLKLQQSQSSHLEYLRPSQSIFLSAQFSEDLGTSLTGQDLSTFGGFLSQITGTGVNRTLLFTAESSQVSYLARIGTSLGGLRDSATNANKNESWLYMPVIGESGPVIYPSSREINVRAGRTVMLDLRDPALNVANGQWRVMVQGLAPEQSLSHGVRDAFTGFWTVNAEDWCLLSVATPRSTAGGHRELHLTYQKQSDAGWLDVSKTAVSVNVRTWYQVKANQSVEDFNNFTRIQEAWNMGLNRVTGRGVKVEAEKGYVVPQNDDFQKGNVLYGSASGSVPVHGTGVGWRIAGDWDSNFVGTAYGASVIWGPTDQVDIDNNSWSLAYGNFGSHGEPENMSSITTGRGGLGQIVVFAGGNGGPTTNDSLLIYKKEPAYMAIASVDNANGQIKGFSNSGDALHGAVPGSGGSSYAAPHLAGIVALMLEINPGLGFRDVQAILAYGAAYLKDGQTPDKSGFSLNQGRTLNGVGMHFSRSAGFGIMDAYNATRLAKDWLRGYPPETVLDWTLKGSQDKNTYTVSSDGKTVTQISLTSDQIVRLQSVVVKATYTDPAFNTMVFKLISPSGTVSHIMTGNTNLGGSRVNEIISAVSKRFWGEESQGTWTIEYSHAGITSANATVKDIQLIFYGEKGEVSQRHIYTDERRQTWQTLATQNDKQKMLWLDDRDGGEDVIMGSALTHALKVCLGYSGWLSYDGMRSLFTPGTRVENVFGGDGNDWLSGLPAGTSLLLGNQGSDVLIGFGQDSQLEGGDDADWLWVGGNTQAKGDDGSDYFMVYGGKTIFKTSASIAAQLPDFDPNKDMLLAYDKTGVFEVARFDLQGQVSAWEVVKDASFIEQLNSQWQSSLRPNPLGITVSLSSIALDFGMKIAHEASTYTDWTLSGRSPETAVLADSVLTLGYDTPFSGRQVMDLSKAEIYSPLGLKMTYQSLYFGNDQANALNASTESAAVIIYGAGGADELTGGGGADLLVGSTGSTHSMRGGASSDVFRIEGLLSKGGASRIFDFSLQEGDTLDLNQLLSSTDSRISYLDIVKLSQDGNNLLLNFDLDGQGPNAALGFNIELNGFFVNNSLPDFALSKLCSPNMTWII